MMAVEWINSMCICLDVIFTIRDSFNRTKHLENILVFHKICYLFFIIGSLSNIFVTMNDSEWYDKYSSRSLYYTIPLASMYALIMIVSLLTTLISYMKIKSLSKGKSKTIFR